MGITVNCLLNNYLPNPVVNEMNDLVILVQNSPSMQKPSTTMSRMPHQGSVTDPCNELSLLSCVGEGKAAQGQRGAACLAHPRECVRSWEGLGVKRAGNEARAQFCLPILTCKARGYSLCSMWGRDTLKNHGEMSGLLRSKEMLS